MSQRVADRRILNLIRRMLKSAVVMPDGTRIEVVEGTPQGGPLLCSFSRAFGMTVSFRR
jgi:RNA-directed DNA polymerase